MWEKEGKSIVAEMLERAEMMESEKELTFGSDDKTEDISMDQV